VRGFKSFPEQLTGANVRQRSETFADHYSQARQFFKSQTEIEQKHIGDALVFELSKCLRLDIRARSVSHLRQIDEQLAATVADGLGLALPEPAKAARAPIDLPASPALSIVLNGPETFKGRKFGLLLSDDSDAKLFHALTAAIEGEGAVWEVVAPKIGGVRLDDGTVVAARQKIDGGPSVFYDAVAVLPSVAGAAQLAIDATAKDFVSDAFAHCKFIAYTASAALLFKKARIPKPDAGFTMLSGEKDAQKFVEACRAVRYWKRELKVDLDAQAFLAPAPE
jgi:catalase